MKPRAPSKKHFSISAIASAMLLALGLVLASATPAHATLDGAVAKFSNADVAAQCQFAVNSVDPDTYAITATIQAVAQPKTLAGYYNNKFTQVFCTVYDSSATLLQSFSPSTSKPVMSRGLNFSAPYSPYYIVCGQGYVKLRNGNDSFTPIVCVSS